MREYREKSTSDQYLTICRMFLQESKKRRKKNTITYLRCKELSSRGQYAYHIRAPDIK